MKQHLKDFAARHGLPVEALEELERLMARASVAAPALEPGATVAIKGEALAPALGPDDATIWPDNEAFGALNALTLDTSAPARVGAAQRPADAGPSDLTLAPEDSATPWARAPRVEAAPTDVTIASPDPSRAQGGSPRPLGATPATTGDSQPEVAPMPEAQVPLDRSGAFGAEGIYEDLGVLGSGGMGEVRRVKDKRLGRTLAMKIGHGGLIERPRIRARFIEEAQIGAQLQHPGVIPVHDMGSLPDGRLYFTMREIKGQEFQDVITEVHAASAGYGRWKPAASGWTFRRLINVFWRVCETMAYAHRRGIIHRDLKPANIMVGQEDEVLVVDWGLALALERAFEEAETLRDGPEDKIQTLRTTGAMQQTSYGLISGTPAYMAPEQASGEQDLLSPRTDVYALGAILYQVLTGVPPYVGPNVMSILSKLMTGPPPPPQDITGLLLPSELSEICEKALSHPQQDRFADAREMADAVSAWLEGVRQRERGLALVAEAEVHQSDAVRMLSRASALEREGDRLLEGVASFAQADQKQDGWSRKDEAEALRLSAELEGIRAEQKLRGALIHHADLSEAHGALALRYERIHRQAELKGDTSAASQAEIVLRNHVEALPIEHYERARLEGYLQGVGALTLLTDPPGVRADLYRMVVEHRRLVPVFERSLGLTPLNKVPLAPGSYLVELHKEGFEVVRYPVWTGRQEHWSGVPPQASAPTPIWMPPAGSLGVDERYVPAGWFTAGGDPLAQGSVSRRRLWCDGFIIERHPVTNARMLEFLDDLVDRGREEEALACVPRERAVAGQGAMLYGRDSRGHFFLQADADGDTWLPDYPVMMVDVLSARSFASWRALGSGHRWRLPLDFEWEKAARGVDGRHFPWGDWIDPSWCCMRLSHSEKMLPASVHDFPLDISPYGVRGMAGNMTDLCLNLFDEIPDGGGRVRVEEAMLDPDRRGEMACRGGAWLNLENHCRGSRRFHTIHTMRQSIIGFRLARSIP